jgi:CsoR family transcriptional regulator, copper-sensing transcriptional repressor
MDLDSPELQTDLTVRLRRIEGQVRGVQRMIEDGRECPDILQQMAAIRSAVHQASLILARAYVEKRLREPAPADLEATLDKLMATLGQL